MFDLLMVIVRWLLGFDWRDEWTTRPAAAWAYDLRAGGCRWADSFPSAGWMTMRLDLVPCAHGTSPVRPTGLGSTTRFRSPPDGGA